MTPADRVRLARGWAHFLRTVERIRRERRGEPRIRIVRDGGN